MDTAPQVNPALSSQVCLIHVVVSLHNLFFSSQPNSSSVHVSQLSNAPQVLALLQSLLHQQQLISASNQALQTELPKQGTEHVISDRVTSLGLPEHISSNSMTATDENDAPLYPETSGSAEIFNTSSDTVNELLRGLSSHPNDQSLQKLCHDTADVLPSFAKAIVSLENKSLECAPPSDSITSISAPILSEGTHIHVQYMYSINVTSTHCTCTCFVHIFCNVHVIHNKFILVHNISVVIVYVHVHVCPKMQ